MGLLRAATRCRAADRSILAFGQLRSDRTARHLRSAWRSHVTGSSESEVWEQVQAQPQYGGVSGHTRFACSGSKAPPSRFAHRTRSAGSADLVPGVGDDDLDRRAAAGAPAGKLALRAPAIQVTACSFNRELGRPPGQDATTFRWGYLHGLTRFHDLLGEQRR